MADFEKRKAGSGSKKTETGKQIADRGKRKAARGKRKAARVFVAGHNGMVGSAIVRKLQSEGYHNLILKSSKELDLRNQAEVNTFFETEKPEYVFLAAAKVGGIMANNVYRADFLYDNLMIEANVIHASYVHKVKKLLFLGSSCIYPKFASQPMKEDDLLTGILEPTNEPYAIAKIAGIKLCENYRRQYGCDFISAMPTNLYGPGDNYDLEKSHVIPALIRKMHLGKCLEENDWTSIRKDFDTRPVEDVTGKNTETEILNILHKYGIQWSAIRNPQSAIRDPLSAISDPLSANRDPQADSGQRTTDYVKVTLWGTGSPLREFMHVDDLANACYFLMQNYSEEQFINIGSGQEITIKELSLNIKDIVGFKGELIFDTTKPDGTPRKLMDGQKLANVGFDPKIDLNTGLRKTYEIYRSMA